MDDEQKQLLKQIRDLQLEQLALLREIRSGVPPWLHWRFSLLHLLVGMTIFAVIVVVLVLGNG
jgi:hypothetical protein